MKKRFISILIPFLVLPFFIGVGYSSFIFTNKGEKKQNINLQIAQKLSYGNINLIYKNKSDSYVNELENTSMITSLFFGSSSPYLIRSDNITNKRDFIIQYTNEQEDLFVPDGCTIALYSTIEIYDQDNQGITMKNVDSSEDLKYFYPSSESIIDYIEPEFINDKVTNTNHEYKIISNDTSTNKIVYSSLITSDIIQYTANNNLITFYIDFSYKNYKVNYNGDIYTGKMSPENSLDENIYKQKISDIQNAIKNSNIKISFKLELFKNN